MPARLPLISTALLARPLAPRSILMCLLVLGGLGTASGCVSPSVMGPLVRGQAPEMPATGPVIARSDSGFASGSPAPAVAAKEAPSTIQWAELRASSSPQPQPTAHYGATPVGWQAEAPGPTAGPIMVQSPAPVMVKGPLLAQEPERGPEPRAVVQGEPIAVGPPSDIVLGHPVPKVPNELHKVSLQPYTVAPPDILLIESTQGLPSQPVRGQHLVRPDGSINLGIYGASVYVAGMTLDQVRYAVAAAIQSRLDPKTVKVKAEDINVDVLAYNSKVFYVITDGGGYGEAVYRIPSTGNDTVLDAIAQINGLPAVASKKHIWVARRVPCNGKNNILPVDWCGITRRGETCTNYQLFPGDRVYVQADRLITTDSTLAKILSPIERILGVTLLGSSTVNSIRNSNNNGVP